MLFRTAPNIYKATHISFFGTVPPIYSLTFQKLQLQVHLLLQLKIF